jgi:AcrR family transcriptional regulator
MIAMSQTAMTSRSAGRPRDVDLQSRRRSEIIAIATRQFAKNGYAGTDVQFIADEMEVAKGTVYRYFSTKEELFFATVDAGMQQLRLAIDNATTGARTLIERVELGIMGYLNYFDEHSDVIELLIQERANFRDRVKPTYFVHQEANMRPWKDLFRGMIHEGLVRDVPVDRITEVISDLLYGTIFTNHFAGRKKSLCDQCKDVLDILFNGVLLVAERRGNDA